jgi:UDP-N-acetylmuramyl tripeptide synthase
VASARTLAALYAAKAAAFLSRTLGRGGGTAVSGLGALAVDPGFIGTMAQSLGHGSVLITGTNGKTTTSSLVSAAVRAGGFEPLANASGSNLMRGIASTLAGAAGASGTIAGASRGLGVFEVDEATLPLALPEVRPNVAVFLNLFRDQLDRYGEVDAVAALWRAALAKAPDDLKLVLNADDPSIASLTEERVNVTFFGIEDRRLDRGKVDHASDALNCRCGARLRYEVVYFAHIGHWHCPACGRSRPVPQVQATEVELRDGRSLRFRLSTPGGASVIEMGIGGLYNVYNAIAAASAADALGLPAAAVESALEHSDAAFGRQEAFEVDGRRVELYLGKNPAGVNQVLSTLLLDPSRRVALIILNDGIADGRDISWVWDADFETAANAFETVVVSGTRAEEMALRLKYAEWREETLRIERDTGAALDVALAATPPADTLTVMPTYTAMLDVRGRLAKRTGRAEFWRAGALPREEVRR